MNKDTQFKPGQSGNPRTKFKPGNQRRWQPGQSGNPAGIARSRLQFRGELLRRSSRSRHRRRGGIPAMGVRA